MILFPGAPASPEADAARAEIRRLLEQAVDELPGPFRIVLIMREVDGSSVEETASNLGLLPATVKPACIGPSDCCGNPWTKDLPRP